MTARSPVLVQWELDKRTCSVTSDRLANVSSEHHPSCSPHDPLLRFGIESAPFSGVEPVERVWRWLRDRKLSNSILPTDAELDALLAEAMTATSPGRFRSLCHVDWLDAVHDR